MGQQLVWPITVTTSTPFDGLAELCSSFDVDLVQHAPNRGIGQDWNFALGATDSELVTIAHQDDVYGRDFTLAVEAAQCGRPGSAFYFCDAIEITESGGVRNENRNNRIKRAMVATAFAGRNTINDPLSLRLLLGFGNPIVCPTVAINRKVATNFRFREGLRTNMDWLAWLDLASSGPVTHINKPLVSHRVHSRSETARCIDDGARSREDFFVFQQLWPKPVARLLSRLYSAAYEGYV